MLIDLPSPWTGVIVVIDNVNSITTKIQIGPHIECGPKLDEVITKIAPADYLYRCPETLTNKEYEIVNNYSVLSDIRRKKKRVKKEFNGVKCR